MVKGIYLAKVLLERCHPYHGGKIWTQGFLNVTKTSLVKCNALNREKDLGSTEMSVFHIF